MMKDTSNPAAELTISEWLGGPQAIGQLTQAFYRRVRTDPLLGPVFAHMSDEHPAWVAQWLSEVFGGPTTYTDERGGYPHMIAQHRGRALTEEQRARWVGLMTIAADEVGLPADPETRSTFTAYIEWGSRIALANSQPDAAPPEHLPLPQWSWGPGGLPGSALGEPAAPTASPAASAQDLPVPEVPSFSADIAPLFSERDRSSMAWAFDLSSLDDVRSHAAAILEQVSAGRMPCYGPGRRRR
jgi:truncated hemoglobin YjbI